MERFARGVAWASRAFGVAAVALIASAVIVVCHMVFVRAVLGHSSIWQTDFVTYSLIAATFLGSPYVLLTHGHVNVDLLPLFLPPRARWLLALVASAGGAAFCLTLLWFSALWWHEAFEGRWLAPSIWRIRLWIPYSAMPIGLALLCLQYVAQIWAVATGREPPFGMVERGAA